MLSRHFHSLALALVVSTLVLILSGAMQLGLPAAEPHRGLSGIVALLAVLVLAAGPKRPIALVLVSVVLLEGAVGILMPGFRWAVVLHACLAHILFAGAVALWLPVPAATEQVPDTGSPSLRTLSRLTPAVVMLQIFLGAIYRHVSLPVWPHLAGSLLAGGLLLYTGMVVLEDDNPHPVLQQTAKVLIGVTALQMAFGLGAFLGRVMAGDGLPPEWWMTASRTVHVVTGALTLGAAVAYAMQVYSLVQLGAETHPMEENRVRKSVVA
ncbi:MAG: hypothetical protein K2X03_17815 [Bryobacteraceae bacterium]|nr:hypothetical protein [Bryobacteraceae bacterium]